MIAKGKYLRIKNKKASIVAGLVRGESATEALSYLRFVPKKSAKLIYKVLKSAISNAESNFKKKVENLYVSEIIINKGPELKRIRPVSRGRAHRITKGVSHITIKLSEKEKTSKPTTKNEEVTVKKLEKKEITSSTKPKK